MPFRILFRPSMAVGSPLKFAPPKGFTRLKRYFLSAWDITTGKKCATVLFMEEGEGGISELLNWRNTIIGSQFGGFLRIPNGFGSEIDFSKSIVRVFGEGIGLRIVSANPLGPFSKFQNWEKLKLSTVVKLSAVPEKVRTYTQARVPAFGGGERENTSSSSRKRELGSESFNRIPPTR